MPSSLPYIIFIIYLCSFFALSYDAPSPRSSTPLARIPLTSKPTPTPTPTRTCCYVVFYRPCNPDVLEYLPTVKQPKTHASVYENSYSGAGGDNNNNADDEDDDDVVGDDNVVDCDINTNNNDDDDNDGYGNNNVNSSSSSSRSNSSSSNRGEHSPLPSAAAAAVAAANANANVNANAKASQNTGFEPTGIPSEGDAAAVEGTASGRGDRGGFSRCVQQYVQPKRIFTADQPINPNQPKPHLHSSELRLVPVAHLHTHTHEVHCCLPVARI